MWTPSKSSSYEKNSSTKKKKSNRLRPDGSFNFEACGELELAQQLCLIDFQLFQAIRLKEFIDVGWTKDKKNELTPNIVAATAHFEAVSQWVQWTILDSTEVAGRVKTFQKFLKLAQRCEELNNFNSAFAIYLALSADTILRLRKTWAAIPEKDDRTYRQMEELFASDNNFRTFRGILVSALCPCLPYLGLFLSDLFFIEEGNKNLIDKRLINFHKRGMLAERIRWIRHFQQEPYHYEVEEPIQQFLFEALERAGNLNVVDLRRKSRLVEPNDGDLPDLPEDMKSPGPISSISTDPSLLSPTSPGSSVDPTSPVAEPKEAPHAHAHAHGTMIIHSDRSPSTTSSTAASSLAAALSPATISVLKIHDSDGTPLTSSSAPLTSGATSGTSGTTGSSNLVVHYNEANNGGTSNPLSPDTPSPTSPPPTVRDLSNSSTHSHSQVPPSDEKDWAESMTTDDEGETHDWRRKGLDMSESGKRRFAGRININVKSSSAFPGTLIRDFNLVPTPSTSVSPTPLPHEQSPLDRLPRRSLTPQPHHHYHSQPSPTHRSSSRNSGYHSISFRKKRAFHILPSAFDSPSPSPSPSPSTSSPIPSPSYGSPGFINSGSFSSQSSSSTTATSSQPRVIYPPLPDLHIGGGEDKRGAALDSMIHDLKRDRDEELRNKYDERPRRGSFSTISHTSSLNSNLDSGYHSSTTNPHHLHHSHSNSIDREEWEKVKKAFWIDRQLQQRHKQQRQQKNASQREEKNELWKKYAQNKVVFRYKTKSNSSKQEFHRSYKPWNSHLNPRPHGTYESVSDSDDPAVNTNYESDGNTDQEMASASDTPSQLHSHSAHSHTRHLDLHHHRRNKWAGLRSHSHLDAYLPSTTSTSSHETPESSGTKNNNPKTTSPPFLENQDDKPGSSPSSSSSSGSGLVPSIPSKTSPPSIYPPSMLPSISSSSSSSSSGLGKKGIEDLNQHLSPPLTSIELTASSSVTPLQAQRVWNMKGVLPEERPSRGSIRTSVRGIGGKGVTIHSDSESADEAFPPPASSSSSAYTPYHPLATATTTDDGGTIVRGRARKTGVRLRFFHPSQTSGSSSSNNNNNQQHSHRGNGISTAGVSGGTNVSGGSGGGKIQSFPARNKHSDKPKETESFGYPLTHTSSKDEIVEF